MKSEVSIQKLKNMVIQGGNFEIHCHSANAEALEKSLNPTPIFYSPWNTPILYDKLYGIPIYKNDYLPRYMKRWEFPYDKYIEYGPEDEIWSRPINFGRLIETTDLLFYIIDRMYFKNYIHPILNTKNKILFTNIY